ncbi:MAG: hypothetical protein ACK40C_12680 [Novosphingobium meiothermophilum]
MPGLFVVPVQKAAIKDEGLAHDEVRLAQPADPSFGSPVHAMHEALARLDESQGMPECREGTESRDARWPGWTRLAAPVVLSAGLWAAIYLFVSRLITSVM